MKTYLLILSTVALCLGQEEEWKWLNPDEEQCINNLSLNKEHLKSVISKSTLGKFPENDEEFLKFAQCRAQQQGMQNKNGDINFENLSTFIKHFNKRIYGKETGMVGEKLATGAIANCKNVTGQSSAQHLVRIENCVDLYLLAHLRNNQTLKE